MQVFRVIFVGTEQDHAFQFRDPYPFEMLIGELVNRGDRQVDNVTRTAFQLIVF